MIQGNRSMRELKSKLVLVVRKDLNMSIGKTAAQVIHALRRNPDLKPYGDDVDDGHVCITCYVKSEKNLYKLVAKAKEVDIPCSVQVDGGRTEVTAGTPTVMALGPVYTEEDIETLNKLTKKLQLL
jgi:peptidyl-tRNA hydrolase, PTH2 family